MMMDDKDGQMIFGDLGGLKLPDICLTGEEKPEKTSPRKLIPTGNRTQARCVTSAHATTCSTAVDLFYSVSGISYLFWLNKYIIILIIILFIGKKNNTLSVCTICYCWVLRRFLTSQVISVASDIEREKSDKFCWEALILAWGSFTCHKSTTRDPRIYFPSKGSYTQEFYTLKNPLTPAGFEPANLGYRCEYENHWTTVVDSVPYVVHNETIETFFV